MLSRCLTPISPLPPASMLSMNRLDYNRLALSPASQTSSKTPRLPPPLRASALRLTASTFRSPTACATTPKFPRSMNDDDRRRGCSASNPLSPLFATLSLIPASVKLIAVSPVSKKKKPSEHLRSVWPLLQELVRPRRKLLALGFLLMVINRVCGMVLPASSKILFDNVLNKHQTSLLEPLVLAVLLATMIQGVTSFTLTQLLSKEGQRLIAELRRRVQEHVGRLPIAYYDANKSGVLVSRVMNDVEGIRNLIGTGLVDFAGGILTAVLCIAVLLWISPLLTGLALFYIAVFSFWLQKAFTKIRPIFRERGKINADVAGRLTESLSGVRVVKGYHAEEREAAVFSEGVTRLLNNVLKSLTATSLMGLSATILMGIVGATIWYVGAHQIMSGKIKIEDLIMYIMFLAMLIAPVAQVVNIGTQLTEALAGLDRTREVLSERPEDRDPNRTEKLGPIRGEVDFANVGFAYDPSKQVLFDVSFQSAPGTVTALVGSSGSGKSTI